MKQIRVMLVDDSPVFISILESAIEKEPNMQVAGKANNGLDALDMALKLKPDVIICDVQMPKMSGIEFLKRLLQKYQVPVVVVSSTPGVTLTALNNGAVDFIAKPAATEPRAEFIQRVITTINTAASSNMGAKMAVRKEQKPPSAAGPLLRAPSDFVVAIGASTGGTDAILAVVRDLPENFPGTVVTQHMPAGFTAMYAARLNKECKMKVDEAKDGMRLQPGQIILAAGEHQMRLLRDSQGFFVSSKKGPKVNGHIPSVEVLFESVADVAKNRSIGVILTGMGADGADGLLTMRKAGAFTIGQDQKTSVVYGMPMMAFNKGAVTKQMPLDQITAELIRQVNAVR
ncbi:chemotaxis-specific protein-glutamate methyltransferase CheB [Ruminococcaceae bacterium OttesenSCG-928-I18]|nr:chemotaxis-specific protein-glutamate methyltransferase CheB [Ruminococcaceae bacterium OttesenSCG-928-I18]